VDINQAVILALLQGFTEFLPISSSAHLILMPVIAGWDDQGLAFDVAVHVGTLTAVVLYYREQLRMMVADFVESVRGRQATSDSRMVWYLVFGTIPVGLFGIAMPAAIENALRSPLVIAAATILFAFLLWWADKNGRESVEDSALNWKLALLIGFFQAVALIPGTSRSGITISAGLLLGFRREFAARFSFLLSIPAIALAGMLKTVELIQSASSVAWSAVVIGIGVSAVTAYLTIGWFIALLRRIGLFPFVVYRFLLGVVLLGVFL
jgi:undecaprenyl-diphosphatase